MAALTLQLNSILKAFSNLSNNFSLQVKIHGVEFLACECGSDGSEGFAHSILQLNTSLYNNRTETNLAPHFMKVSGIMSVILCSESKRHWNSKESAQEVLLQASDLG